MSYPRFRSRPVAYPAAIFVLFTSMLAWRVPSSVVAAQTSANAGVLSFTDITAAAGMSSTESGSHGAFWGDATGDGLPDLYMTYNDCRRGARANRFYRNLGGTFSEEAAARGIASFSGGTHGGGWLDLDNDGDYDLLNGMTYATACPNAPPNGSVNPDALPNRVFRNVGAGIFANRTPPSMTAYAGYTRSTMGLDIDRDGNLDIVAVNGDLGTRDGVVGERNELYLNDGNFNFTAITTGPVVTATAGQSATDTDYDGDGDVDIIMPDIYGELIILRNDGFGNFSRVSPAAIGIFHTASTGISSGDLNNDGLLDLILIDQDRNRNPLGFDRIADMYLNAGNGTFTFVAELRGFGGFTAGLADLDNDGDLDLTLPGLTLVLLNDGTGRFSPGPFYPTPTPPAGCIRGGCTFPDPRTVAFSDFDGDGDLDSVVTAKLGVPFLIRNNFNAGNWLKVQLVSPQGQAGAFGAKVHVFRPGTTSLIGMREAKNVTGYLAQDDPVLHFGLGSATTVDVQVTFLDGTVITAPAVGAGQKIVVTGTGLLIAPDAPHGLAANVAGNSVTLDWQAPAAGALITNYQLEAGTAPRATNIGVFNMGLFTGVSLVAPNGSYYVRVRARNLAGLGPASTEILVSVPSGCAPAAPGPLSFTQAGSLVTLNWGAPAGAPAANGYILEVGSLSGASNLLVFDTGSTATTLSASAPPGRYFVRVRSRAGCVGPASNEVMIDVS